MLDGGRIAEAGSHEELIEAGGPYARLYGAWRLIAPDNHSSEEPSPARRGFLLS